MAEDTTEVKVSNKAVKGKTLKVDFDLHDGTTGTWYRPGHVFEGEIPLFVQAQINFGVAELV